LGGFCPLIKGAAASAGGSVHLKRVAFNLNETALPLRRGARKRQFFWGFCPLKKGSFYIAVALYKEYIFGVGGFWVLFGALQAGKPL